MHVRRFHELERFAARAQPWLLRREAEHNLLLGIFNQLRRGTRDYVPPFYFATVEEEDTIRGCVFRTPPYPVGMTSLPPGAVPLLVEDLAATYSELPGALGPDPTVRSFATRWAQATGTRTTEAMRQRIYELDRVEDLSRRAPGSMRPATLEDLPLAYEWARGFAADTGVPLGNDLNDLVDRLAAASELFLWTDGGSAVSMAASVGTSPNGARIGYVYTPPENRGHGYASVLVATLSQHLLEQGRRFCFLYTDVSNPTTNAIYRRIGYQPVAEVTLFEFDPAGANTGVARR